MSLPVRLRLFSLLTKYARDLENGAIRPGRLASTSPALVFCENFYAQFFQNELHQEIRKFNQDSKTQAVRLRVKLKKKKPAAPRATIQLITWFEKLCDIYPNLLALSYGGGSRESFRDFHANYLITLIERAAAWSKAKRYTGIETKARQTRAELRRALERLDK